MDKAYFEDKIFNGAEQEISALIAGDYEHCTFNNCDLSGSVLSWNNFSNCIFNGCNLSNAKLIKTSFIDISFKGCKMIGLHFDECNDFLFTAGFDDCILDLSSFHKLRLKKMLFTNCSLQEVDFEDCDLTNSSFINCNLAATIFVNTILEKADFRSAYNYSIDPERNRIKKAKFSSIGLAGLLNKYDIEIE